MIFAAMLLMMSCMTTTKQGKMPEFERSYFYVQCMLMGQLPVSVCECIEGELIKQFGTVNLENKETMGALEGIGNSCVKELQEDGILPKSGNTEKPQPAEAKDEQTKTIRPFVTP
jgi:hypothetical protein